MISEKIKAVCRSPDKRMKLIFAAGIIGIALILLSEFVPQNTKKSDTPEENSLSLSETEEYEKKTESRLADIISDIKGVGKVKVMVTVSGTKEYVYAEQSDVNRRTDSGGESFEQKSEIVLSDGKTENQPLVKKITVPQISGAVIVCEGASDDATKERVMNAACAALGLSAGKVCVEPMQSVNGSN